MSITILKNEINRFLASEIPEVICIKGKWGVGKTFSWNNFVSEASSVGKISLSKYSYVSLFGLKSLNELKYAVFESTVAVSQMGLSKNDAFFYKNYDLAVKNFRKVGGILSRLPKVQAYIGISDSALFFSVRKQLVCIDDLERASSGLGASDVLGLISMMKEQRGCKIVLLLNEEELREEDRKVFDRQLEKVADVVFDFNPTADEVCDIVFPAKTGISKFLHINCSSLGIVNIRIIKKIERFAVLLSGCLKNDYPQLIEEAMHSVALFCWVVYQPSEAPSIEFLQTYNSFTFLLRDKEKALHEQTWHNLLSAYTYSSFNDLDKEILKGIKAGYFDEGALKEVAAKHATWQQAKLDDTEFNKAWDLYHNSFDDDQEVVADAIFDGAKRTISVIHPANLNSSVVLLRDLGRSEQATDLISCYVDANPKMLESYDPSSRAFWDIKDSELLAAFEKNAMPKPINRTLLAILLDAASNIYPEDLEANRLSNTRLVDYISLFKATKGDDKRMLLKAVNAFINWQNQNEASRIISLKMQNALKSIGQESLLNARRVAQFVSIPENLPAIDE
jgi:hypothetical protein